MNSKLIIASGIKLDKEYANVLTYDTNDMLSLVENNALYSEDNYNHIDYTKNEIMANVDYSVVINCNYIAFQNPRHGNKWYFAFIDDVKYKATNQSLIYFTVDVWATFFDDWSAKSCFVIREHVNDDTIGLHTVPESVTTGDYINTGEIVEEYLRQNIRVVLSANIDPDGEKVYMQTYNGIPSGFAYFCYRLDNVDDMEDLRNHLNTISLHNGEVNQMFLAPKWLAHGGAYVQETNIPEQKLNDVPQITQLDTYTPVNKKLLTYPYCFYKATNLQGQEAVYKQELWDTTTRTIDGVTKTGKLYLVQGCLTAGCSIRLIPIGYLEGDIDNGINCAKFPQLNWSTDNYINWLTQQGINQATGTISSVASNSPNAMQDVSSFLWSNYQAHISSPQAKGNLNASDVMYASGYCILAIRRMTIKREYAKQIDNYFSRYGYKINETKMPNIYGRQNFNFLQIGKDECIGYGTVPSKYMDEINNICRQGVTIWHNHTNLGNYSVSNPII